MTTDPVTEIKHRAAASRERAAQYEALAAEAKERGDFEMSAKAPPARPKSVSRRSVWKRA